MPLHACLLENKVSSWMHCIVNAHPLPRKIFIPSHGWLGQKERKRSSPLYLASNADFMLCCPAWKYSILNRFSHFPSFLLNSNRYAMQSSQLFRLQEWCFDKRLPCSSSPERQCLLASCWYMIALLIFTLICAFCWLLPPEFRIWGERWVVSLWSSLEEEISRGSSFLGLFLSSSNACWFDERGELNQRCTFLHEVMLDKS